MKDVVGLEDKSKRLIRRWDGNRRWRFVPRIQKIPSLTVLGQD